MTFVKADYIMNGETRAFSYGGERPFVFWEEHTVSSAMPFIIWQAVQIIHAGRPPYNA